MQFAQKSKETNKHNINHPHHFHPIQSGRVLIAVHTNAKAQFKAKIKQSKQTSKKEKQFKHVFFIENT